jgi:hypothetical protein
MLLFLVWVLVGPFALGLFALALEGNWAALPFALVMIPLLAPWPLCRMVFIPLGWPRPAARLAGWAHWTFGVDRHGGAVIGGAWALLRSGQPRDLAAIDRLEARLSKSKALRGAGICGAGLLAAARGELADARALLESVSTLDNNVTPRPARRIALEWLAVDAVASGEWTRALEIARNRRPRSRLVILLGRIAGRLLAVDRSSAWMLWVLWAIAPRRRATLALVRRALSAPIGSAQEPSPIPVEVLLPEGSEPLVVALGLRSAIGRRPAKSLADEDFVRLGRSWDRALDSEATKRWVIERAAALGACRSEQLLDEVSREIEQDLGALALERERPLGPELADSEHLRRASRVLREKLFTEIEGASEAIARRAEEKRALSPIDEWREWLRFKALADRGATLGGVELVRLIYPKVHGEVGKLSVWLWNVRKEKAIANAIFRWMRDRAIEVGDASSIELENKNVKCGSG